MNILYVYADKPSEWNCSNWRCNMPSKSINRVFSTHKATMISVIDFVTNKEPDIVKNADIVIVQRIPLGNIFSKMMELKAQGKTVLVDLDDAYNLIPRFPLEPYKFWNEKHGPYTNLEQLQINMAVVDGLTSPSELILEDWNHIVPGYLVPNYPETKVYKVEEKPNPELITIGWGGSTSHYASWRESNIIPALIRVLKKYEQCRLKIFGFQIVEFARNRQVSFIKWQEYENWPKEIAKFDIGLIPLYGNYDQRRSWVKPLEYGMLGIPWISVKYNGLKGFEDFGMTLSAATVYPNRWEAAISELIENLDEWKTKAQKAIAYTDTLDIDVNIHKVISTYESIKPRPIIRSMT